MCGNFVNEHYEERYSDKNDSLIEAFDVDEVNVKDLQVDLRISILHYVKKIKQIQVVDHATSFKPNNRPAFEKTFGIDKDECL